MFLFCTYIFDYLIVLVVYVRILWINTRPRSVLCFYLSPRVVQQVGLVLVDFSSSPSYTSLLERTFTFTIYLYEHVLGSRKIRRSEYYMFFGTFCVFYTYLYFSIPS